VGFLAVDQVMVESERIIGLCRHFVFRYALAEIIINVSRVVVDHHNHSSRLDSFERFFTDFGIFQKRAKT
jgi:hypothetical protein